MASSPSWIEPKHTKTLDVLTPAAVVRQRLLNQQLVDSSCRTALDVVRRLGAVQAQDYAAAKWALALRARGLREADVDAAFDEGAIVRTHVLRPTWHFVAPDDLRWMLALTAPRIRAAIAGSHRRLGLEPAALAKSRRTIARALAGGQYLTRMELSDVLRRTRLPVAGLQRAFLMIDAEIEGVICSGPRRGQSFTYALLDERVPGGRASSRDEALGKLARTYFASHGPATLNDFAWWSGLSGREARAGIDAVAPALERETVNGRAYWFVAARSPVTRRAATVHLLPNFDEYLVAYQDREPITRGIVSRVALSRGDLLTNRVILNGIVVGTWKRTHGSHGVAVEITLTEQVGAGSVRAMRAAADAYGSFLQRPIECSVRR